MTRIEMSSRQLAANSFTMLTEITLWWNTEYEMKRGQVRARWTQADYPQATKSKITLWLHNMINRTRISDGIHRADSKIFLSFSGTLPWPIN